MKEKTEMLKINDKKSKKVIFLAIKYEIYGLQIIVDSYLYSHILFRNGNDLYKTKKEVEEKFDVLVSYLVANDKATMNKIHKVADWHRNKEKYNKARKKFKPYITNCKMCQAETKITHHTQLKLCDKCRKLHFKAKEKAYMKFRDIRQKSKNNALRNIEGSKNKQEWKYWDIVKLLQLREKNMSFLDIAKELKRTLSAVKNKHYRLHKTKRYLDFKKYLKGDENED